MTNNVQPIVHDGAARLTLGQNCKQALQTSKNWMGRVMENISSFVSGANRSSR